jgi:hypothetical protein
MKKIFKITFLGIAIGLGMTACNTSLDLAPISSISDANYWKTADQFDAFVSGVHSRLRSHNANIQALGEMRSIYLVLKLIVPVPSRVRPHKA